MLKLYVLLVVGVLAGCTSRESGDPGLGIGSDSSVPADDAGGGGDAGPGGDTDGGAHDGGHASDGGAHHGDAGEHHDAGATDGGHHHDGGAADAAADAGAHDAGPPAACPEFDLGSSVGAAVATDTTIGAADLVAPSCGFGGGPDATFLWTAPHDGTFTFLTNGSAFDTVLSVRSGAACTATELECDDDGGEGTRSRIDAALTSGQQVVLVLEGFDGDAGDYQLGIYESLPVSESSCTDGMDEDLDGDTDCADFDCDTDAACLEADCTNGADDDGDGDTDCADSDCDTHASCVESCTNGMDDDADGAVDCYDYECSGDAACAEAGLCTGGTDDDADGAVDCADTECTCDATCLGADSCYDHDLGSAVGTSVTTGSSVGRCSFRFGSCAGDGGEVTFQWMAPAAGTYTFDTLGSSYDTVLYVLDATCTGTELACNDDSVGTLSEVTATLTAGQTVILVLDAYGMDDAGTYVLNIAGP